MFVSVGAILCFFKMYCRSLLRVYLRLWANNKPTLNQRLAFVGICKYLLLVFMVIVLKLTQPFHH